MKPKIAVWKFASCDGCQLSILDLDDELLELTQVIDIVHFAEASKAMSAGPYDVSIVDGSITTEHDRALIERIRAKSGKLIAIGACACRGGVQALKNLANLREFIPRTYPRPEFVDTLPDSTPVGANVAVDLELQGCPINRRQLVEALHLMLKGANPEPPSQSVCVTCKRRGTTCVLVAHGTPCLGPVTHDGCGALCTGYDRGCYGCFGPMDSAHPAGLNRKFRRLGMSNEGIARVYRTFNTWAPEFRAGAEEAERNEQDTQRDQMRIPRTG